MMSYLVQEEMSVLLWVCENALLINNMEIVHDVLPSAGRNVRFILGLWECPVNQ